MNSKITRVKAIRNKCIDCSETNLDRSNCKEISCPLHNFRMGKRPKKCKPDLAIKKYCKWCSITSQEVIDCPDDKCALYPYRHPNVPNDAKSDDDTKTQSVVPTLALKTDSIEV